jgi:uncharacterized glyoxalase superfamily protein PhnB
MTENKLWQAPTIVPVLVYDDVPRSVDWLCKAFGFRERADARLTGEGFCRAWLDYGDGQVVLTTPHQGLQSPSSGAAAHAIKMYVEDLDAHCEGARAAGAQIITEPEIGFWGGRRYEARDPEGHLWNFAEAGGELDASLWELPPGVKLGR